MSLYDKLVSLRGDIDVNYHAIPSPRLKMFYMTTPKVACTTIKKLLYVSQYRHLGDARGEQRILEDARVVHHRRDMPLPQLRELDPDLRESMLAGPEVFRFAFVRDPYSRLLSSYLNKIAKARGKIYERFVGSVDVAPGTTLDFATFVDLVAQQTPQERDPHWRNQTALLNPDLITYSFIGKMETLETDIVRIVDRMPEGEAITIGVSGNRTGATRKLAEHYTPALKSRVQQIYSDDFEAFGYPA